MNEKSGIITFKGKPMILMGPELKAGDTSPDFQAISQ